MSDDSNVNDDSTQSDTVVSGDQEGGLASKLGIPESCDESFDVGASGADSIKCKVKNIDVPDSGSMKKMYYETNSYDTDTVQKIVESLFDKEEGIYVRDDDVYTKDEIQDYIDSYDKQIQEAIENGNGEFVEELEQEKRSWQEKLTSASDSLPAVTVYDPAGEYYGMHDGHEFTINFNNDFSMGSMGTSFSYKYTDKENQKLAEEVEGATSMYFSTDESAYNSNIKNTCEVSEDAAIGEAMDFLADMGVVGLTVTSTKPLIYEWMKESSSGYWDTLKAEIVGYEFYFERKINGANVSDTCVSYASNLSAGIDGEDYYTLPAADYIYIQASDDGVVNANGTIYVDGTPTDGEDEKLLSWDDMLEAANTSIAEYYAKYPTPYSDICFDSLSLCYLASVDENGNKCFIPVWEFKEKSYSETDTSDSDADRYNVQQVAYIDAVSGSYIDIVDVTKKLGTCYSE